MVQFLFSPLARTYGFHANAKVVLWHAASHGCVLAVQALCQQLTAWALPDINVRNAQAIAGSWVQACGAGRVEAVRAIMDQFVYNDNMAVCDKQVLVGAFEGRACKAFHVATSSGHSDVAAFLHDRFDVTVDRAYVYYRLRGGQTFGVARPRASSI